MGGVIFAPRRDPPRVALLAQRATPLHRSEGGVEVAVIAFDVWEMR